MRGKGRVFQRYAVQLQTFPLGCSLKCSSVPHQRDSSQSLAMRMRSRTQYPQVIAFAQHNAALATNGQLLEFLEQRQPVGEHGQHKQYVHPHHRRLACQQKFEQETLSLVFSVRYPVTLKYERVYPRLSRGFTLGGFTETEMTHAAAIYMPPESELIRRLSKVYEEQTGEKAELKSIGGGTYAKSMPNLVAFGPIFPGDEVREHKPDEYMEIERVLQNAEIIAAAMYELAK